MPDEPASIYTPPTPSPSAPAATFTPPVLAPSAAGAVYTPPSGEVSPDLILSGMSADGVPLGNLRIPYTPSPAFPPGSAPDQPLWTLYGDVDVVVNQYLGQWYVLMTSADTDNDEWLDSGDADTPLEVASWVKSEISDDGYFTGTPVFSGMGLESPPAITTPSIPSPSAPVAPFVPPSPEPSTPGEIYSPSLIVPGAPGTVFAPPTGGEVPRPPVIFRPAGVPVTALTNSDDTPLLNTDDTYLENTDA